MTDLAMIMEKLKNSGLKNTKHRLELMKLLHTSAVPLSADSLYAKMKKTDILISLSTVYRALETLIEKDLVSKIQLDSESKALYEFNRQTHHHFLICIGCNKIFTLKDCPIHEHDFDSEEHHGFQIIGHKLELYGYCEECQKKIALS